MDWIGSERTSNHLNLHRLPERLYESSYTVLSLISLLPHLLIILARTSILKPTHHIFHRTTVSHLHIISLSHSTRSIPLIDHISQCLSSTSPCSPPLPSPQPYQIPCKQIPMKINPFSIFKSSIAHPSQEPGEIPASSTTPPLQRRASRGGRNSSQDLYKKNDMPLPQA